MNASGGEEEPDGFGSGEAMKLKSVEGDSMRVVQSRTCQLQPQAQQRLAEGKQQRQQREGLQPEVHVQPSNKSHRQRCRPHVKGKASVCPFSLLLRFL